MRQSIKQFLQNQLPKLSTNWIGLSLPFFPSSESRSHSLLIHDDDGFQEPKFRWQIVVYPLLTAVVCGSLHVVCSKILHKYLPILQKMKPLDRLYVSEAFVSGVHAVLLLTLGSHIIFSQKAFSEDVLRPYPHQLDYLFSITLGYSLWDSLVMYLHGEGLIMWIHHFLIAIGSIIILFCRQGAFFPCVFTITEMTAIPQNLLWILNKLGYNEKDHIVNVLLIVRAIFAVVFRAFLGPAAIYHAVMNTKLTWEEFSQLTAICRYGILLNVSVLSGMNLYWSGIICKRALKVIGGLIFK